MSSIGAGKGVEDGANGQRVATRPASGPVDGRALEAVAKHQL